ncbi:pyrroline-5-carboxylate reductase family protein [Maritalea mediterranea]|uniref:Pyrroline-5-carboxylate reductase n=1 Tax=Maritalea mediterranea TaxID=2909667 RepID=A0ABS9E9Q9_9HYPH|nr:pyrroline-5-carboxylate reductase dimerization domain-containing protein [Maritalea mediterranea]MCF4099572.1 NAD(P)-binding domain-containing protein [Maritalea mediterranea]
MTTTIGLIGGSGALGGALATALLQQEPFADLDLWISNRSGAAPEFASHDNVYVTSDNQKLVTACDIVFLSVPPAQFKKLKIDARDRLVISVMAGITIEDIAEATGASRIVRAMSSPAAAKGLAYSPWVATAKVTSKDREAVRKIFSAAGITDELEEESHLNHFTAMTGPVPGFVAYFAQCMVDHAVKQGIAPEIAERAVRQLFLASGQFLADETATPAEQVQAMVDYAGTTAAGLTNMIESDLSDAISEGLLAAARKAEQMR